MTADENIHALAERLWIEHCRTCPTCNLVDGFCTAEYFDCKDGKIIAHIVVLAAQLGAVTV